MSAVSAAAARLVHASVGAEVLVLPNGIDPQLWRGGSHVPRQGGPLRVVSVLRLAPRKRVVPLLHIAAQVAARTSRGVAVVIVGDGPALRRAQSRAVALMRKVPGLTVRFTGRLDRSGILQQFAEADLFVQPSVRESFGLAALEARCAGVPVLARAETGSGSFLVDGQSGRLVSSDSAMVAAIVELASDPQALQTLREGAEIPVAEMTWPSVLAAVDEAYRGLLA